MCTKEQKWTHDIYLGGAHDAQNASAECWVPMMFVSRIWYETWDCSFHCSSSPRLDQQQQQHSYTIHYACPYICSSRQSPFRIYHIPLNLSEWKIDWCGGGWNGERWSGREVIPFICKNWNETYIILEDFIGNYDNDIEYSSIFLMINFYYKI